MTQRAVSNAYVYSEINKYSTWFYSKYFVRLGFAKTINYHLKQEKTAKTKKKTDRQKEKKDQQKKKTEIQKEKKTNIQKEKKTDEQKEKRLLTKRKSRQTIGKNQRGIIFASL